MIDTLAIFQKTIIAVSMLCFKMFLLPILIWHTLCGLYIAVDVDLFKIFLVLRLLVQEILKYVPKILCHLCLDMPLLGQCQSLSYAGTIQHYSCSLNILSGKVCQHSEKIILVVKKRPLRWKINLFFLTKSVAII